ncbi:purine-cytosine permease family protein [Microbacterium sp.]|uniref:purine-cytosine permease family protein n=1 Tax=Microbacterium sp. TaxID=51671 RepID=UPI002810BD18|nr:cytosine permease [Microbacterium sp.]
MSKTTFDEAKPPITQPAFVDTPTHPETRGIELIADSQRHGRARDLFAVWAAPNVSILNFTIGATMVLLGLELWQAFLVIVVGSLPWVLPGIIAVAGPSAGTSGSVITRAIYGIMGNKVLIALTGWLISAVYLALNWLASSFMGADLLGQWGLTDPVVVPIAVTVVVSLVTVLVAVYGHALILRSYQYVTGLLLIIFLAVVAFLLPQVRWDYQAPVPLEGVGLWSAMTIGFTILASTPLSYVNSPDIARYLPRSTKPSHIIAATALGGALPCIFFTIAGALLATAVPAEALGAGVEVALRETLPVWFAPILVLGVLLNTISLNGMTTYTSSMALQAIGIPIRRIPSAILVGVIGTALTIYLVLSTNLLDAVNLMLQFLIIVSAPTMALFATDVLLRRFRYDGLELFDETPRGRFWYHGGVSLPGAIAMIAAAITAALCLSTEVWSGPIAVALGYVDLSVPASMIVAVVLYTVLVKSPLGGKGRP